MTQKKGRKDSTKKRLNDTRTHVYNACGRGGKKRILFRNEGVIEVADDAFVYLGETRHLSSLKSRHAFTTVWLKGSRSTEGIRRLAVAGTAFRSLSVAMATAAFLNHPAARSVTAVE